MRARLRGAALAALLLFVAWPATPSGAAPIRFAQSGVVLCTATRAHVALGNPARGDLTLFNAGTVHANLGMAPHAGANFQGMTLHAGAYMELGEWLAGLDCQTAGGSTAIEVLEGLK